jgi:hypothetical protein
MNIVNQAGPERTRQKIVDRIDVINFDVIRIDELTDIKPFVILDDISLDDISLDDIRFEESTLRESFNQARKEAAYGAKIFGFFICCDCRLFADSHGIMCL